MGPGMPFDGQDWAKAQAAYRFFSNDYVSEQDIWGGHFQASSEDVVAQPRGQRPDVAGKRMRAYLGMAGERDPVGTVRILAPRPFNSQWPRVVHQH